MLNCKHKLYLFVDGKVDILQPEDYDGLFISYADKNVKVYLTNSEDYQIFTFDEIFFTKDSVKLLIDADYNKKLDKLNEQPESNKSKSVELENE